MNLLQDRDRDGRISYAEFCGKKTINEKAFEVPPFHQMAFDLEIISNLFQSYNLIFTSSFLSIFNFFLKMMMIIDNDG